ncbi:hypothetical protein [Pseudomonas sp. NA-150]|uniref:hypothetical protein n=1 Tax=Pseudomonas sp. NA-150 TaxID=3367525 RepID=UPI0037C526AA
MMRFFKYCAFALCACFDSSAFAGVFDRPAQAFTSVFQRIGDLADVSYTRMELTLAQWRTGSEPTDEALKSNLRASSNHFEMASAKPLPDSYGLTPC